jgi:IS30 family transposase
MVMDASFVANLKREGLSIREIGRRTGIPKSTVLELLRREDRAKQQDRKALERETARANIKQCLDRGEVYQARDYALIALNRESVVPGDIADLLVEIVRCTPVRR